MLELRLGCFGFEKHKKNARKYARKIPKFTLKKTL